MSFQRIRSMTAVAALTAGVSWLLAGPPAAMSAVPSCQNSEPGLLSSTSIASFCDGQAKLRLNNGGHGSGRMVTSEAAKVSMAAGDVARHLGLTGLATGKEVLGVADMGGVTATWGMPSLTSASPALFPMAPMGLATMTGVPALALLPEMPQTPLENKLPGEMPVGQAPFHNRIAGSDIESPTDLDKPVREVTGDVIGVLLPKAVESIEGTSMLPGGGLSGFSGLSETLGLH